MTTVWTVGAGGLLGSAVARASHRSFDGGPIPWSEPTLSGDALRAQARQFSTVVGDAPWGVVWAAGAATTATSATDAARELEPLSGLLEGIRSALPRGPGAVFITSSAGGVYAGSANPPFTATTPPVPVSPYGELKMEQEAMANEILGPVCPVVIGRVSNLYGPGQNLAKLQGLVSRLALAAVTRQPVNIFVSLDTIRDYIYVDDAARAILDAVGHAAGEQSQQPTTLVVASGEPATVGQVIRTMNLVAKRRVPVALGSHPSASAQAPDIRLEPTRPLINATPLPTGMKAVYLDVLARVQHRSLIA
jgi:UDP-glucose 4-epimerase